MKKNGLAGLCALAATLALAGCGTSALYKPEMAKAAPNGVFFLDLRNGPFALDHPDLKKGVEQLLTESCRLPENRGNAFCENPSDFSSYVGQVSNGLWINGPWTVPVVVPKSLAVRAVRAPSEKDGDIIRARIIPGPVSMFIYDGVIERNDDPDRACKWAGTHNYSGGVVCPKYGYDYKQLDVGKIK